MKITGQLFEVSKSVKVTANFQKREFILEYARKPKYPEWIKFELVQDQCGLVDDFRVGQTVEVDFDLRGRKWTDQQGATRYFNSLRAWQITAVASAAAKGKPARPATPAEPPEPAAMADEAEDPF